MPVSETVEAAYLLEDQAGVQLGPVVVNGWDEHAGRPGGPPPPRRPPRPGSRSPPPSWRPSRRRGPFRLRRHELAGRPGRAAGPRAAPPPAAPPRAGRAGHRARRARPPRRAPWAQGWRRSPRNGRRRDPGGRGTDGGARSALSVLAATRPVVVCCGPGGVGKTTVSATFALEAARAGPPGLRGHGRPGPAPGRRARASSRCPTRPTPVRGRLARRAARPHARHQGHLRRPRRPLRPDARAGRVHPGQPHLPEPGRRPVGHPGVHGHGEALRADRGRRLRPGGGRHPAHPQRPRPARRPPPAHPLPREPASSGRCSCPPGPTCGPWPWPPRRCCGPSPRWRGPRSSRTPSPSSRPSRGWRRGSDDRAAAVRRLLADPSTAYVLVTSPRPDAVEEAAYFAGQAGRDRGRRPAALVVNRVHPRFGRPAARLPPAPPGSDLAALVENLERSSRRWPTARRPPTPSWSARWRPSPVGRVPLLGGDVHDLDGLGDGGRPSLRDDRRRPGPTACAAPAGVG